MRRRTYKSTVYLSQRESNSWDKDIRYKPVAASQGTRYRERVKGLTHGRLIYKTSAKRSSRP